MWDFIVRVVCERECEDSRQLKTKEVFEGSSREAFRWSEVCAQHMTGMWKVMTGWWQLVFASVSRVRPSREMPAKHSILPIFHIWYTRSLPTPYILTLPTYVEECFQRENPSHYPWKWEIVIPTILYKSIRIYSPNTYHTHPECKVRFWYCWKALKEVICLVDAIGLNCVIRRVREDKTSLSQLVAGAWRARVHGVD